MASGHKEKALLDLALDCASLIGIHKRSYEDLDETIQPDLIRHIAVIGAPVNNGAISDMDALTVYHSIEELAKAGFLFDPDITWDFYDLQNTAQSLTRPKFQSGTVHVHQSFIQDKPKPADLVIATGLKPPGFITASEYGALEAAEAFSRGVESDGMFDMIKETIRKSGARFIASRDSGVNATDLADQNAGFLSARPASVETINLPRDYSLDIAVDPEALKDYIVLEEVTGENILNKQSLLLQRLMTKLDATGWKPPTIEG